MIDMLQSCFTILHFLSYKNLPHFIINIAWICDMLWDIQCMLYIIIRTCYFIFIFIFCPFNAKYMRSCGITIEAWQTKNISRANPFIQLFSVLNFISAIHVYFIATHLAIWIKMSFYGISKIFLEHEKSNRTKHISTIFEIKNSLWLLEKIVMNIFQKLRDKNHSTDEICAKKFTMIQMKIAKQDSWTSHLYLLSSINLLCRSPLP